MKTRIVQIGNSRGVRIPKPLLEQSGLGEEVEVQVHGREIVIRAVEQPRSGWEAAFTRMAAAGDDQLLDPDAAAATEWDEEEWQW